MKIKHVRLPYGVPLDGKRIKPAPAAFTDGVLDLLEPVDGITSITVRAPTVKDTLDVHAEATADYVPNTPAYNDAVFRGHLERRADPVLTPKQVDRLSGPDHDALRNLVEGGVTPEGKRAHRPREGVTLERNAYVRLHFMNDRKVAEQRLATSRADAPMLYEAHLVHAVTRFGDVSEASFDRNQVEWNDYLNLTFFDHFALSLSLAGRDYKEITEVLDGVTEVDGKPLPFPGDAGDDPQEAAAQG
jgi:hypothetical protein